MNETQFDGRAIEQNVMRELKRFQRRTVDYVFDRLYGGKSPTHRFLVADEVGLGKTLVAKGVIAKTIDHLQRTGVERIDVIYICSNAEIAAQNVRRLNVTGNRDLSVSTRITLLPRHLERLNEHGINFISFTPGTSFDMKSRTGVAEERAVIFRLLEFALHESLDRPGAYEVLRGSQRFDRFQGTVANMPRVRDGNVPGLDDGLARYLQIELDNNPALIARLRALIDRAEASELAVTRWECSHIIGELRQALARSCVEALEPDLVIIDEFQRFRELLQPPNPDDPEDLRNLAHKLFEANDARVLMLSATPYKMFTMSDEEQENHYEDFLQTCRFLMGGEADELAVGLRKYNSLLRSIGDANPTQVIDLKKSIERRLRRFMTRTERLSVSVDRGGMLRERKMDGTRLEAADLRGFAAVDRLSQHLETGDTVEYWKSSPYLLNFMGNYKLKRALRERTMQPSVDDELVRAIAESPAIAQKQLQDYQAIEPGNARLRALAAETVGADMWRLLWMPAALPYYRGEGAYIEPNLERATKRLVFSSWNMVPDAVSSLLSYEAERQMMRSRNADARNTPEERAKLRGLLSIRRQGDQPAGMSTFALLYPSATLAKLTDPLVLAQRLGAGERTVTAAEMKVAAIAEVDAALAPWIAGYPEHGLDDQRWYWLAPILLDRTRSNSVSRRATLNWFDTSHVLRHPTSGEEEGGDDEAGAWGEHLTWARQILFSGERRMSLGRVPADLVESTAMLGLGAPGNCALRALGRITGEANRKPADLFDPSLRDAALRIAWGFRGLFNVPEVMALLRGAIGEDDAVYWRRVAQEGFDGNLQAVLDEFVHLIPEWLGHTDAGPLPIAEHVANAVSVRAATYRADEVQVVEGRPVLSALPIRARFALRFGQDIRDEGALLNRSADVRAGFNSPFWPFVLVSTSVGQEGLDFHQYCHAIVHWNLPMNPVDMEQREGRVHRYKGHAIRKNVAERHGPIAFGATVRDPWHAMFLDAARHAKVGAHPDIEPYWVYEGHAKIERCLPLLPLSKDAVRMERLRASLALYRLVFGQPRQDDLLAYLADKIPPDSVETVMDALRIDLSPR